MRERFKLIMLGVLISGFSLTVTSQNNTSSPYSRYGLNTTSDLGYTMSNGMGGVGIALRDHYYINPLNPASYTSIDSQSFVVEIGLFGQGTSFDDGRVRESAVDANFQYFALAFPMGKHFASSVGVKPYSVVGYGYGSKDSTAAIGSWQNKYNGGGSINQVYWSVAYQPVQSFSVGVAMNYLFGKIYHNRSVSFADPTIMSSAQNAELYVHNLMFQFGAQYMKDLGNGRSLTLGATFTPAVAASSTFSNMGYTPVDTISVTSEQRVALPQRMGLGISYANSHWLLSADYSVGKWKNNYFMSQSEEVSDKTKWAAGLQYIDDPYSRNFFKRLHYRGGFHYTASNIVVNGNALKETGITLGVGVPLRSLATTLNVACELGRRGSTDNGMIQESYAKLMVSFAFYDNWFYKRRFK